MEKLFENQYFLPVLLGVMGILVVLFIVVALAGRNKGKKKEENTGTVDAFKEVAPTAVDPMITVAETPTFESANSEVTFDTPAVEPTFETPVTEEPVMSTPVVEDFGPTVIGEVPSVDAVMETPVEPTPLMSEEVSVPVFESSSEIVPETTSEINTSTILNEEPVASSDVFGQVNNYLESEPVAQTPLETPAVEPVIPEVNANDVFDSTPVFEPVSETPVTEEPISQASVDLNNSQFSSVFVDTPVVSEPMSEPVIEPVPSEIISEETPVSVEETPIVSETPVAETSIPVEPASEVEFDLPKPASDTDTNI